MIDETDCFPAFSQNINYIEYPPGFNPANLQNLQKYNGKQDPLKLLGDKFQEGNLLPDGPRIGTSNMAGEPEARHDPLLG